MLAKACCRRPDLFDAVLRQFRCQFTEMVSKGCDLEFRNLQNHEYVFPHVEPLTVPLFNLIPMHERFSYIYYENAAPLVSTNLFIRPNVLRLSKEISR